MSAESNLYDIEGQLENALSAVFTAAQGTAITPQTDPQFQQVRPRTEIVVVLGEGQGIWKMVNGHPRETSWAATVNIGLVTESKIATHTAFRAQARALMANAQTINDANAGLAYHKLQSFFGDGGTSPVYSPEEGVYRTDLTYNVNISVQNDAWAALPA